MKSATCYACTTAETTIMASQQQQASQRNSINVKLLLLFLAMLTLIMASLNFLHVHNQSSSTDKDVTIYQLQQEIQLLKSKLAQPSSSLELRNSHNSTSSPTHLQKSHSVNSYHWPSSQTSPLVAKISALQNPQSCSDSKFFVWRSRINYEEDTRGLTAWGHAAKSHLMHGQFILGYDTCCCYWICKRVVDCEHLFLRVLLMLGAK